MKNPAFLSVVLLVASQAFAQGTEGPGTGTPAPSTQDSDTPAANEAKALVAKYLSSVREKKWGEAKKWVHPKTIEAIAERKKRIGKEDHPMAPWFLEKTESYLKEFKVGAATLGPLGTVVVEVSEDNFQVAEKGLAQGEMAAYLVGKKNGNWCVVDKKRGETFSRDSIRIGYKGWFDPVEVPAE